MSRPKMPEATPLSVVLANADAALKAEGDATSETLDEAVARRHAEAKPYLEAGYGSARTTQPHTGLLLNAMVQATAPSEPSPAASASDPKYMPFRSEEELIASAHSVMPYLYAMQENFVVAAAGYVRRNDAMGYAEFCLRTKMAEALAEYALQVLTDLEVDAAAFVRSTAIKALSKEGEK